MKRFFALFISVFMAMHILVHPVSAAESVTEEHIVISQIIENMGDGSYYIETISIPAAQTYANTKKGTKTAQYISSGTTVYALSVTGTFTYDGTTADATSASYSITTYVEDATVKSCNAYTSGASAVATGSVSYKGFTLQKTVTLTCDKNGNLS